MFDGDRPTKTQREFECDQFPSTPPRPPSLTALWPLGGIDKGMESPLRDVVAAGEHGMGGNVGVCSQVMLETGQEPNARAPNSNKRITQNMVRATRTDDSHHPTLTLTLT